MKEILPQIIENLKNSYFGEKYPDVLEKVINEIKSFVNKDKMDVLNDLARRPSDATAEWNLHAVAWRTIERTIEYPFSAGDTVLFGKKEKKIKSIDLNDRSAVMENKESIGLFLLKPISNNNTPVAATKFEQMSFF